jgi:hypothetical protein
MQSAIYGGIPTANPTFLWLRRFGRQWIPGREVVVVSHFRHNSGTGLAVAAMKGLRKMLP